MLEVPTRHPEDTELGVPLSEETREEAIRIWEESEKDYINAALMLKEDILEGRWGGIIADDTRARFPALVMRGIISRSYDEQKLGRNVDLSYLAGARFMDTDSPDTSLLFDGYLKRLKEVAQSKRLLFITDQIESGETVAQAIKMLSRNSLKFDILSFYTDYAYGEPKPSLETILEEYDPEAKIYHLNSEWGPGNIAYSLSRLRRLDSDKKGFYWPLNKRDELTNQRGSLIPVAVAKRGTEEYGLLRRMSRDMAKKVYHQVFQPDQPEAIA